MLMDVWQGSFIGTRINYSFMGFLDGRSGGGVQAAREKDLIAMDCWIDKIGTLSLCPFNECVKVGGMMRKDAKDIKFN